MVDHAAQATMHAIIARARSLWRGLRRRADVEAEMTAEFRHHLALLTEDLIERGVPPAEAARRARVEFGHVGTHKADARAARGLGPFDQLRVSWLDVKLGLRMLRKYPGLSLVSVVGMSVAIAVGAGYFGVIGAFVDPTLPLHAGDRVVAIQNASSTSEGNKRQTFRDLAAWRDGLTSVRELSAFETSPRNLLVPGRSAELVELARMTASGFRVARVAPALGRALLPEDEREGAAPVVVIAHDEWQRVFGGDPAILGRTVRLGSEVHTVVGVMPPGFHFPVNHEYWVPLTQRTSDLARGDGPNLVVFGRLADGAPRDAALRAAQSELAVVGTRMAVTYPETHRHLRPHALPYTHAIVGIDSPAMATAARGLQLAIGLLLVLVAANVAILVYARVATRTGEIAVRTALGASRKRVITQLFVEAFVLSTLSAVIGLTITGTALRMLWKYQQANGDWMWPFWIRLGLTPAVVAYVAGLAILAGVIVGVLPALQATGKRVQAGLQQLSTRGAQQQLGRMWTALIVFQVAIAVAILPSAMLVSGRFLATGAATPQYPVDEILRTTVSMEYDRVIPSDTTPGAWQRAVALWMQPRAGELIRRLEAEPGVAAVTVASNLPGREAFERVEVEGAATTRADAGAASPTSTRFSRVDPRFFEVFGVAARTGRTFVDGDARAGSNAVVVDQVFVDRLLKGGPVLGRRIRLVSPKTGGASGEMETGPWLEVVGVVPDFIVRSSLQSGDPAVYAPMSLADAAPLPLRLAVRVRGGSASRFVGRLRDVAASVDPALQLDDLRTASDFEREDRQAMLYTAIGVAVVTASVLLLSATGIYAMMSFTVTRRRREIGIRAALGADRRRILAGVFVRAATQLGAGVLVGLALSLLVGRAVIAGDSLIGSAMVLLPTVAALMMAVGLLAALGPARRGLAVQPTEALREE